MESTKEYNVAEIVNILTAEKHEHHELVFDAVVKQISDRYADNLTYDPKETVEDTLLNLDLGLWVMGDTPDFEISGNYTRDGNPLIVSFDPVTINLRRCKLCVESASEGMGDVEDALEATVERVVDGEEMLVCVQCAECIDDWKPASQSSA